MDCQKSWDIDAEYFRNTLVAMVGEAEPVSQKLLHGKVKRSLDKKPQARADFLRNAKLVPHERPSGIVEVRLGFEPDWKRINRCVEKIVRGAFFKKSSRPLSRDYSVHVECVRVDEISSPLVRTESFMMLFNGMEEPQGSGDEVFAFRCKRDANDHDLTAWIFWFYQHVSFLAWTQRIGSAVLENAVGS
jgi:hypothetical protein